jgi:hypothetical protein
MDGLQRHGAGPDLVGQGGKADLDPFLGVALGLPVQGLMLAELLEQDHGQQVRPGPAPRRRMERRRRLADLLAIPAGELLADGLDDLPLPGDDLQRLGDVLAHLHDAPDPQQVQAAGASTTTRSRGRCSGTVCGPGGGVRRPRPSPPGPLPRLWPGHRQCRSRGPRAASPVVRSAGHGVRRYGHIARGGVWRSAVEGAGSSSSEAETTA